MGLAAPLPAKAISQSVSTDGKIAEVKPVNTPLPPIEPLSRPEPSFDEVKDKLQVSLDIMWEQLNMLRSLELESKVMQRKEQLASLSAQ